MTIKSELQIASGEYLDRWADLLGAPTRERGAGIPTAFEPDALEPDADYRARVLAHFMARFTNVDGVKTVPPDDTALLRQALEALEGLRGQQAMPDDSSDAIVTALRERLK